MNSLIARLKSFTPLNDLQGEFVSPFALANAIERVDTLENQQYDVRPSKKPPLLFNVLIEEKAPQPNGDYVAKIGAYHQSKENIVASLDLKLAANAGGTTISYICRLKDGLKTKIYVHLIVLVALVLLSLSTAQSVVFFGIFFVITAYTIVQEWTELKNVKRGLVTLVQHSL